MSGSIIQVWLKQSLSEADMARIGGAILHQNLRIDSTWMAASSSSTAIVDRLKTQTTMLDFLNAYFDDKPDYRLALSDWRNRLRIDMPIDNLTPTTSLQRNSFVFELEHSLVNPRLEDGYCNEMRIDVNFDTFKLLVEAKYVEQEMVSNVSYVIDALSYLPSTSVDIISFLTAEHSCAMDMAYLAIEIAKVFDGWIYIHCGVNPIPEPILEKKIGLDNWQSRIKAWKVQNSDWVRNFIKQFPGTAIEIKRTWSTFHDEENDYNIAHLVDVEFMKTWMKHAGFRVCRQ
jgi:hypothetical protein